MKLSFDMYADTMSMLLKQLTGVDLYARMVNIY